MRYGMTKTSLAVLPLGWVVAAALAAGPAVALAQDGYAQAADISGTAEFVAQVWMPSSSSARPASTSDGTATAADLRGTKEFVAEVWMPSSSSPGPGAAYERDAGASETGAASGEPQEAAEPVASSGPADDRAAREHQRWVESIWSSP
jgi:hypothetical protein